VVVTLDRSGRQLLVGEVIGDYEHRVAPSGSDHVRAVEWYGRYSIDDRSILSAGLAAATQLDKGLHELTPTNAWMSFVAAMRERPALAAVVRVASVPASSRRSSAASRSPRAASKAAAPVKAKPAAPVHLRCPGCQMQKIPAQFRAGSLHCVDCRERLGED
jgi:predicted Mrr-cat superfamily restriction endonuclease